MAMTRALVHLLLEQSTDPAACLTRVNRFLQRDMPLGSFMSLFLGVIDPGTREFVYASAGHNPPILWRPGGRIEEFDRTGPILGAMPDARFRCSEPCSLEPGDVLLLYTDGLTESKDVAGEMYDEERLRDSLDRHAASGRTASGVLDGLLADLDRFRRGQPLEDDITALVVRAVG
jgi:sigma-B regulation protein RsbU (phosphoserine phosphatase)